MIKRIMELLDYLKNDISPEGLDYVFPEAKNVVFYDDNDVPLIEYRRLNKDYFAIADYENLDVKEPETENDDLVSNDDMLKTVKQALVDKQDSHKLSISKLKDGYEIHVFGID